MKIVPLLALVAASVLAALVTSGAADTAPSFSDVSTAADVASEVIVKIEVYDYTAPSFSGTIAFGDNFYRFSGRNFYRFSDRDARERVSHGDMRIREVLVPVDSEAVLSANGSEWPISICLRAPATKYNECIPTSKIEVLNGALTFGFMPEGWDR